VSSFGRPVPTRRSLWIAAATLAPAAVAVLTPEIAPVLLLVDLVLVGLVVADFFAAPRASALIIDRTCEPIWSSGRANVVRLELRLAPGAQRVVRGELRDWLTPGPVVDGARVPFEVSGVTVVEWRATPMTRGPLQVGPLAVRLLGPLGLCSRQVTIELVTPVKVFPDLTVLSKDALTLARAQEGAARKVTRVRAEGREFESLREYRTGDDRRSIDWKATARRGRAMVRQHRPEQNQQVVIWLDCGRHMTGEIEGRRKVDHAVDAALRLARVALDQGDLVGVGAYGRTVKAWLPPRRGLEHLATITRTLSEVQATLEESDVGAALDQTFARGSRRALVVLLTDLLDPEAAQALVARTRKLVPRHLPMIVSLQDQVLHDVAHSVPVTIEDVHERVVASRLERDGEATVAKLREGGARVVRGPPSRFASAGVDAYLDVKNRGLL